MPLPPLPIPSHPHPPPRAVLKKYGKRYQTVKNSKEFILLANHELGATQGVERAHGAAGAFVSKWWIDSRTLRVKKGEDLIKKVFLW
jgi:hypothetical protein